MGFYDWRWDFHFHWFIWYSLHRKQSKHRVLLDLSRFLSFFLSPFLSVSFFLYLTGTMHSNQPHINYVNVRFCKMTHFHLLSMGRLMFKKKRINRTKKCGYITHKTLKTTPDMYIWENWQVFHHNLVAVALEPAGNTTHDTILIYVSITNMLHYITVPDIFSHL